MSKPANKTVIGIFVVGAIALAVIAIVVLGSGKLFQKTTPAVCYFEGSVGGLNVGAPVVFRGVKIGMVTEVVFRFDPKEASVTIPVFIELEQRKKGVTKKEQIENFKQLIDRGLKAQLEMQSIVTGQLQIALDFYPDKPAKFVRADPDYFEIPTIQSPLQELTKKIEKIPIDEIFEKLRSTLAEIEKIAKSPEIWKTLHSISQAADETMVLVKNVNSQVTPLASNANETVKELQKLVKNVDQQLSTLTSDLGSTVKDVQRLVQNIDGQVKPVASGIEETVKDVRKMVKTVDDRIPPLASSVDDTLKDVQKLVKTVDGRIQPLTFSIEDTLKEVRKLVQNTDNTIDRLGPSIEKTLEAASESLKQVQATLQNIGGAKGEDSALIYQLTQALQGLTSAARSMRLLADHLERRPETVIWGK